ncbi:hypothetical protein CRG98_043537 [Punica granatum]|uniref:Elongation factor EFG domain-containing protein n=1 Tax=Punica granatum TaxID=22663 RepID=A0A2I0HXS8_PUNGR|nr:hypothetical protein CRG98_043537 [Punica granatum]
MTFRSSYISYVWLQSSARVGPLIHDPMRSVKFKIVGSTIAPDPVDRGAEQIAVIARHVVHSSFLLAAPRLIEPVYHVEIKAPIDRVSAIRTLLIHSRGHFIDEITGFLPVIESFTFERKLSFKTQSLFDH